jgi:hypothetical protein
MLLNLGFLIYLFVKPRSRPENIGGSFRRRIKCRDVSWNHQLDVLDFGFVILVTVRGQSHPDDLKGSRFALCPTRYISRLSGTRGKSDNLGCLQVYSGLKQG